MQVAVVRSLTPKRIKPAITFPVGVVNGWRL
jgi:hypothetical protein